MKSLHCIMSMLLIIRRLAVRPLFSLQNLLNCVCLGLFHPDFFTSGNRCSFLLMGKSNLYMSFVLCCFQMHACQGSRFSIIRLKLFRTNQSVSGQFLRQAVCSDDACDPKKAT